MVELSQKLPKEEQSSDNSDQKLRNILRDVLGLAQEQVDGFDADTELFGALPELDSMAVAGLLTEIEDRFDIIIDDEDVDGETFENYGSLLLFTQQKLDS